MRDAMVRQLVAESVRTALEEGVRRAPDPIAYLRGTAMEVESLMAVLDTARPAEGAAMRAIIAEEVVAVARALLGRHQN